MDWQSPTSHPLHMAQALSELIKRHFFTSPDAREERRRKEGEKKRARRGHTALSFPGLLVNEDFSQCPLLFLYSFILPLAKKKNKKIREKKGWWGVEKTVFPIMFCQIVFAISKTIVLR